MKDNWDEISAEEEEGAVSVCCGEHCVIHIDQASSSPQYSGGGSRSQYKDLGMRKSKRLTVGGILTKLHMHNLSYCSSLVSSGDDY